MDVRAVQYLTDLGITVWSMRAFVDVEFVAKTGPPVAFDCFVDTGAPFSIIPYSLWHDRNIEWQRLGLDNNIPLTCPRPTAGAPGYFTVP